jgi:hypothetical protein
MDVPQFACPRLDAVNLNNHGSGRCSNFMQLRPALQPLRCILGASR